MPKLKTHKGVARRAKITGSGKLVHFRAGRRHLLTRRQASRMRQLRKITTAAPANEGKLRRLIPYS